MCAQEKALRTACGAWTCRDPQEHLILQAVSPSPSPPHPPFCTRTRSTGAHVAEDKTHRMTGFILNGSPQTSSGHLCWQSHPFHWSIHPSTRVVTFLLSPLLKTPGPSPASLLSTVILLLTPLRKKQSVESSAFSQRPACPRGGAARAPIWAHLPPAPAPRSGGRPAPSTHPRILLCRCRFSLLHLIFPSVGHHCEPTNKP